MMPSRPRFAGLRVSAAESERRYPKAHGVASCSYSIGSQLVQRRNDALRRLDERARPDLDHLLALVFEEHEVL